MQKRQVVLALALAATLGATWWASRVPEPTPAMAPRVPAAVPVAANGGPAASGLARGDTVQAPPPLTTAQFTRVSLAEQASPRAALAWGPPPAPPPPVLPKGYKPPPPPAPPLPFKSIGKLEDGANTIAFLLGTDRTYVVRAGDTIDNSYRVEEVTPQRVVLTFLPLKARQELSLIGP